MVREPKIIELFQPLRRRFPSWVQDRYRAAVTELKKLNDESPRYWVFAWECIASAEKARAWKAANKQAVFDRDETMRQLDLEYIKNLESIINAINITSANLEKYPFQAAWTVGSALLKLKDELGFIPLESSTSTKEELSPFEYGHGTAPDIVTRLLRHMSAVLTKEPLAKTEVFDHWKCFGPIRYEKSRFRRTPDLLVTGLLFEAVYFSRTFASGGRLPPALGSPMPLAGRPCWPLAVALLSGALDEDLTENDAEKRLSPILEGQFRPTWFGWHEPPSSFVDFPDPRNWF